MKKNRIRLAAGSEKLESRELLSASSSAFCCCPVAAQTDSATATSSATSSSEASNTSTSNSTTTENASPVSSDSSTTSTSQESNSSNNQEGSESYATATGGSTTTSHGYTLSQGTGQPIVINNINIVGGGRFARFGFGRQFGGNAGSSSFNASGGFAGQLNGNLSGNIQGATNVSTGGPINGGEGGKKGRNAFLGGGFNGGFNGGLNGGFNGGFNGAFNGGFNGTMNGQVTSNSTSQVSSDIASDTDTEITSEVTDQVTSDVTNTTSVDSVSSTGTGTVTESVNTSLVNGITINNFNFVDGFAGFGSGTGGFGGNFQGQVSGNISGQFDGSIGSTREFNGNMYNLIRNRGDKWTFKNTSLPGGQRTVDFNPVTGSFKTHSPIVLDLDGSGRIETTGSSTAKHRVGGSVGQTVSFDINGDGRTENIEWLSGSGDGLLVDDRDGQAATSMNGNRLFGDANGQYSSGYEKLAKLDVDGNGVVSGSELAGLKVWIDNGDAKVDATELKSLAELGIEQISVQRNDVVNAAGETLMQSVAQRNGQTILTEDVWFGQA